MYNDNISTHPLEEEDQEENDSSEIETFLCFRFMVVLNMMSSAVKPQFCHQIIALGMGTITAVCTTVAETELGERAETEAVG
ncbi:hypothetical protein Tco_0834433, partial [Tanacetum coccineum]